MKTLLFSLLALPGILLAQGGLPTQPYIYVMGIAGDEKVPDIVTLRFDLVARAPEQSKANADVQARSNKAFSLLHDRKIGDNDIVAEEIRSEADFEETGSYTRRGKLVGYVVTRRFNVKVRDINAFPKLVDDLIAAANAEFTGIEGTYSKEKELTKQLWDKALANAREQAERTAKQVGTRIDSVFAVSPAPFPDIVSNMFPRMEKTIVTGSNIATQEERQQERVESQYRLAPVSFTQSAHVIYLISSAK